MMLKDSRTVDSLIRVLTRAFTFPSSTSSSVSSSQSAPSSPSQKPPSNEHDASTVSTSPVHTDLISTLRFRMLTETSGSMVVWGPLLILEQQPDSPWATAAAAGGTTQRLSGWSTKSSSSPSPAAIMMKKTFQTVFQNCSIHWSWEDAIDDASASMCLLTLLSTSGYVGLIDPGTVAGKSTDDGCKVTFQKFQLTLEQTNMSSVVNNPSGNSNNTNSKPQSHIKAFCKFDAVHGFDRIWHNLVLSTSLEATDMIPSTSSTSAIKFRFCDLQVSCPLMDIDGAAAARMMKHETTTQQDLFLARWLSWLHRVATPDGTIQSPSASTLQIDMITKNGSVEDSKLYVPLFPQYGTDQDRSDAVGTANTTNENSNNSNSNAVDSESKSNPNTTDNETPACRDPLKLEGGVQTLGDVFRIYHNASQDALFQVPAFNPNLSSNDSSRLQRWSSSFRQSVSDSLAITAGCVATGASFVTPVGMAVSVATVALKDTLVDASQKGKEARGADTKQGYKLGDISRGISTRVQQQKERSERKASCRDIGSEIFDEAEPDEAARIAQEAEALREQDKALEKVEEESWKERSSRYAGVVGSGVGAAAGMAIAGPVGIVAGSVLGGVAGSRTMKQQQEEKEDTNEEKKEAQSNMSKVGMGVGAVAAAGLVLGAPLALAAGSIVAGSMAVSQLASSDPKATKEEAPPQMEMEAAPATQAPATQAPATQAPATQAPPPNSNDDTEIKPKAKPYRFGDFTRRIVSKGKESDGRASNGGYKFGDFTRGLLSKK